MFETRAEGIVGGLPERSGRDDKGEDRGDGRHRRCEGEGSEQDVDVIDDLVVTT